MFRDTYSFPEENAKPLCFPEHIVGMETVRSRSGKRLVFLAILKSIRVDRFDKAMSGVEKAVLKDGKS